jgi:hypothetical protein
MAALEKLDLNYVGIPEVLPEDIPEHIRESGINPKLLNLAAHFGLIFWGWTVKDYMAYAIKTMGYETIHNWGVQGCKKSNLTLQQGSWCYGERVRDQWYEDWDRVLKYLVFRPGREERGFLRLVKSISMGERIAWSGWDDLGVHYPSSVFKTDIEKYQAIDAAWAIIRTKISVISTNNPIIDRVAKNIKDNISIEVFLGRNQMLMTERFCHIPGLKTIESFFFKVPIEKPYQFDYEKVPPDVWKEYWDIRLTVAETAIQKLDQAYSDEAGDISDYVPVYDLLDQGISSPSQLLAYGTRGMINLVKIAGKQYVLKDDVEHVLKRLKKPPAQKVTAE